MNNFTTFLTTPEYSLLGNDIGHFMVFRDKKWSFHSREGKVPLSASIMIPHIAITAEFGDSPIAFLPQFGNRVIDASGSTQMEFLIRCFVPNDNSHGPEMITRDFPFGTVTYTTSEMDEIVPRLLDWLYHCQSHFTHATFR